MLLNLNIMGDMPTENQIEFFIKIRAVLDETRFGMGRQLPDEYTEYSRQFEELIQKDEDLMDWMIFMLTFPSGINSAYLWYCCQGMQRQKFFEQNVKLFENAKRVIHDFKSQREPAFKQLIDYAIESINSM